MPITFEAIFVAHAFYYTAMPYILSRLAPSAPAPRLKARVLRRFLINMHSKANLYWQRPKTIQTHAAGNIFRWRLR
jgi:hypothetical protein